MTAKVRIREIVAWHLFKFYFYIGLSHPFMQSINRMRKYDFSKVPIHKWRHPLRSGGGICQKWHYFISLFSKMGDNGEGGVKNVAKWVTSFMDGPEYKNASLFISWSCYLFIQNNQLAWSCQVGCAMAIKNKSVNLNRIMWTCSRDWNLETSLQ